MFLVFPSVFFTLAFFFVVNYEHYDTTFQSFYREVKERNNRQQEKIILDAQDNGLIVICKEKWPDGTQINKF
jgi:hypothetical protein